MRYRSIIAILVVVGAMCLAGCTDPAAGATPAPGASSPATPAPTSDGDYAY